MKWPWISRAEYDRLLAEKAHALDVTRAYEWYEMLQAANADYRDLLEKYHALKLTGATIPAPLIVREQKEPDMITQTITALSKGRPGLRAQMMKQLAEDRKNPLLNDAEILSRIEEGVTAFEAGVP